MLFGGEFVCGGLFVMVVVCFFCVGWVCECELVVKEFRGWLL